MGDVANIRGPYNGFKGRITEDFWRNSGDISTHDDLTEVTERHNIIESVEDRLCANIDNTDVTARHER